MGLMLSIVSRFRKRATTREVLEGIDEDIKRLESTLERNQELQKKIVLSLLTVSVLLYFVAVTVFYFLLLPNNWSDRALWILPFFSFPFLVYLLKRCFHFIFVTRIKKIGREIDGLNERKKEILGDVTENETYKVAKELLEKFDPHGKIIKRDFAVPNPEAQRILPTNSQHDGLRHRTNAAMPKDVNDKQFSSNSLPATPVHRHPNRNPQIMPANINTGRPTEVGVPSPINPNGLLRPNPGMTNPTPSSRKYPILPMERSVFDKVAEYFVGDGPSYRYALICKFCHSHNGMALKDEFEYIAFRCCYCGALNSARKSRLNAPPLEDTRSSDKASDKEKTTESEPKSQENDINDSKDETEEPQPGTGDEEKSEEKEDEEHNLGEDETNPSDAENEDKRNASN